MSRIRKLMNKRGFTLVELLIVVAIIGILSTIGIPTYQRMVQKSRKSEAKVALGGLYTVEAAFFSEYGAYGNNLDKIGFQMEGNPSFYSIGFASGNRCKGPATIEPSNATFLAQINSVFPDYYAGGNAVSDGIVVRNAINGAGSYCRNGAVAPDGSTFLATASGVIAPGVAASGNTNGAEHDQWSINESRTLVNNVDGVQ